MDRPRRTAARLATEKLKLSFEKTETENIEIQKEHTKTESKVSIRKRGSTKVSRKTLTKSKVAGKKAIQTTTQKKIQRKAPNKSRSSVSQRSANSRSNNTKIQKLSEKTTATKNSSSSVNVLPHGLSIDVLQIAQEHQASTTTSAAKHFDNVSVMRTEFITPYAAIEPPVKCKQPKKAALVLGTSPFPELTYPSAEQAYDVERLLAGTHGEVNMPAVIPIPARDVAGCGEVKFTLEALIRTMISAHTTMGNANLAIESIAKTYNVLRRGSMAGCIDWNQVLVGGREKLEEVIKSGGMQKMKSRDIIRTLEMIRDENGKLRAEILRKLEATVFDDQNEAANRDGLATIHIRPAEDNESNGDDGSLLVIRQAATEIQMDVSTPELKRANFMSRLAIQALLSNEPALTLDYLHGWPVNKVFDHLQAFPGVGVKTAACVLLFCMQKPLFAVDTHVFRLCKWLGWAPANADRNKVFFHCDVRVPDELKYKLHQLLIVHGKCCLRCRAAIGDTNPGWKDAVCCLEHLLTRTEPKRLAKASEGSQKRKRGSSAKEDKSGNQMSTKRQKTKVNRNAKGSTKSNEKQQQNSPVGKTKTSIPDTDESELSDLDNAEGDFEIGPDVSGLKEPPPITDRPVSRTVKKKRSAGRANAKKPESTSGTARLDDLARVFGGSAAAAMRRPEPIGKDGIHSEP